MIKNSFNNNDNLDLQSAELLSPDTDSNLGDLITPQLTTKDMSLGSKPDLATNIETISQVAREEAYRYFQDFTSRTNWQNEIDDIFGTSYSAEALNEIVSELHANNLTNFPKIQIIDADSLQGANGGYNSRDSLIYLADTFLADNLNNLSAVTKVVLEEVGHFIDAEINLEDSPGDEGEKFVKRLFGEEFDAGLLAEDDTKVITVNEKQVIIEQSNEDLAGNSLADARDLGNFTGTETYKDSVSSQDRNDYYKFNLDTAGTVNFALTGLSANANIVLLDSTGKSIIGSWRPGTKSEYQVAENLDAGDYYLRVVRWWGNTSYDLSLTFDGAGDNLAAARDLGSFTGTQSFKDSISSQDRNDYYKFNLDTSGEIKFALTGLSANANIVLLDSAGKSIIGSWRPGTRNEYQVKEDLDAGDYYLRVIQKWGRTNYNLSLVFDGAGDNLAAARDLGSFTGTQSFKDSISSQDRNDYYKFNLDTSGEVKFALTGLSDNANIVLLDSTGKSIIGSWRPGTRNEYQIAKDLPAGDYYLRVLGWGGKTNYDFSLDVETYPVWQAEYFNNANISGTPVFTETIADAREGIDINWESASPDSSVNVDNFSARFTATSVFETGLYNFVSQADDGVRVYVDDIKVIDKWNTANPWSRHDAYIAIPEGEHTVAIEYYEQAGIAGQKLLWSKTELDVEIDSLHPVGYNGTGIHQTYFDTYERNGSIEQLGSPLNNIHPWGDGYVQDFQGGNDGRGSIMKSNANDYSYWVGNEFWNVYSGTGGAGGILNYPISDAYETEGGTRQDFLGGVIFQSENGTFPIYGGIGGKYLYLGGETSFLYFPTSKEIGIGDGWIIQHFEGGDILYKDGQPTVAFDIRVNDGQPQEGGNGSTDKWHVQYWNNRGFSGEAVWSETLEPGELIFGAGSGAPLGSRGIPEDNFSARWVTTSYFEGGLYDFISQADDGVRVYVDGKLIIDKWSDSPFETENKHLEVEQGYHEVRVDYYEHLGGAANHLRWEQINSLDEWNGEIYRGKDLVADNFVKFGSQGSGALDLNWGRGGPLSANNVYIKDRGDIDVPTQNQEMRGTGDFNNDGHTDIVWQGVNGATQVWLMNNNRVVEKADLDFFTSDLQVRAAGDFNNDGRVDLLWQDLRTNMMHIGLMDDLTFVSTTALRAVGSEWQVGGAGDFNSDGHADILWRNDNSAVHLWTVKDGQRIAGFNLESPALDWQLEGVGDLNDDGHADIVWRHDSGAVHSWLMNDLKIVGRIDYEAPTSDWKILGIGDIDNEGYSDILWMNDNGISHTWLLDVTNDNFSDRWTTTQYFEQAGVYEFTSLADDGVRIWIDGKLAIDRWEDQSSISNTFLVSLSEGHHLIQVEHFENLGAAVNKLDWSKLPGIAIGQPVGLMSFDLSNTPNTLYAEPWVGEYFNNKNLSGAPVLTRMEEFQVGGFIDLNWNSNSPDPLVNADNFSARWTTQQYLQSGTYTFNVGSDDGVRFYINGENVLDRWVDRGFASDEVTITLPEGTHQLQLDYYEYAGPAAAKLTWDYTPNASSFAIAKNSAGDTSSSFENKYNQIISEYGVGTIGIPTSNVEGIISAGIVTPGNLMLPSLEEVAKVQKFKGINYEGALLKATGSNEVIYVFGEIWQAYEQAGGVSRLGVPVSTQKDLGNGAYELELADGIMFWKPGMSNPTLYKYQEGNSLTIPSDVWRAEYFNNTNRSGDPVFVEGIADYGQGFIKQWAASSPNPVVSSDNFSGRLTTRRYLEPGLHHIKIGADDGAKVKIGDQWIINNGFGSHSGYFYSIGQEYDIQVEYYELGGHAAVGFEIDKATPIVESVNNTIEWHTSIFHWSDDGSHVPPSDFHNGGIYNPRYIGVANLGSNANHGLNFNWGQDDAIKANSDLPHDYYAIRAYTRVNLGGGEYKFRIKGDDGVQILIRETGTGNWHYVTPKDEWQHLRNSYGEYYYTLPTGQYDVHVQMYEHVGPAHFDFSYEHLPITQPVDIHNQWNATVYAWDTNQGQPRQDFYNHKFIGQLKLDKPNGNSVRVNFGDNGGAGSLNNDGRLPKDNFAIRAYTQASFDGGEYTFNVQGDDGVQLFAKNIHTNQWYHITPQDQWVQAYGTRQFKASLPNGRYDLHFHMYEHGGLAQFNLDWDKVPEVPVNTGGGNGGSLGGNAILSVKGADYFKARPEFYTTGNIFSNARYGSHLVDSRSYREGNCTWYAYGRVKELGGNVAALNSMSGNANTWHNNLSNGASIVYDPQVGDIAQWDSNHVAVVEKVYFSNGVKRVILSESQWVDVDGVGGAGTLHRVVDYLASNPNRYIRVPGVSTNQNSGSVNDNVEEYNPSIPAPPDTPGSNEQINIKPDRVGNNKFSSLWLGELSNSQEVNTREWINNYDKYDYYSFSVAERSRVNVSLNGMSDNLDLEILNWSSTLLKSDGWNNSTEFVSKVLNPGERYYVKIYQGDSDATTGYDLNISIDTDNIGKLTIYSNNQGAINSNPFTPFNNLNFLVSGHSWLSYKVTDYVENNRATSIYENYTTYGTWGITERTDEKGLYLNLEKNYSYKASRYTSIDLGEEKELFRQIDAYTEQGQDAWSYLSPCSSFANDVWEAVTGETLIPSGIWSTPTSLIEFISHKNGNSSSGQLS